MQNLPKQLTWIMRNLDDQISLHYIKQKLTVIKYIYIKLK
jgi:hypothetical protein